MATKPAGRALPRVANELSVASGARLDRSELSDVALTGDYSGTEIDRVELTGCRVEQSKFTGASLSRCRLVDCVVVASDFSGAIVDDCQLTRVEFRGCRLSGFQAGSNRFRDVGFVDCKIDNANFRLTRWERAHFERCELIDSDFYDARVPNARFWECNLSGVELSRTDLAGSQLHGSTLDRLRGAESLRGTTIASDQIMSVALALFDTMNITVHDEVT